MKKLLISCWSMACSDVEPFDLRFVARLDDLDFDLYVA